MSMSENYGKCVTPLSAQIFRHFREAQFGVFHQIAQDIGSLRCERHAGHTAPRALVCRIKPEWSE